MSIDNNKHNTIYHGYLVDAYLKRAGSFRKLLISLLGFTAAFGFFIAWPYLSAVQQELQLVSDINRLDTEVTEISSLYSSYKQPKKLMNELQKMIEHGPPELRNYIRFVSTNINADYPYSDIGLACQEYMDPTRGQSGLPFNAPNASSNIQQSLPQAQLQIQQFEPVPDLSNLPIRRDSCVESQGNQLKICRIDRFVQYQLCGYEQLFTKQILPALAILQDKDTSLFNNTELKQQFSVVREALRQHVMDNPKFWRTYRDKTGMSVKISDEIRRLWSAIAVRMAPVLEGLSERINNIREMRVSLKNDRSALMKQRKELTIRLERIQSPIGNLPIGLTEAVLLFPIILVIGFCMATASLLEQLRLRSALCDSEVDAQSMGKILSSTELAKVAPLWIEPSSSAMQRLWRWLLMLLPLFAYVGTVMALLRTGHEQIDSVLQQASVNEWVYGLMYIMGTLVFGLCLFLLRRALRNLH